MKNAIRRVICLNISHVRCDVNNHQRFSSVLLAVFFALLLTLQAFSVPVGSTRPWNSVDPDSVGRVSTFNGALNFGIPLLNIGGRGDAGFPLTLRIGSPVWTKDYYAWVIPQSQSFPTSVQVRCALQGLDIFSFQNCVGVGGLQQYVDRVYKKMWVSGGWKVEYSPGMMITRYMEANPLSCSFSNGPGNPPAVRHIPSVRRIVLGFVTPDGAEHEFVDRNTYGKLRYNNCDQYTAENQFSRGTTFVSTDGTSMTYVSDAEPYEFGTVNGGEIPHARSGVLYMPNGTRYRFDDSLVTWIIDRNGNKTTFTYVSSNPNQNGAPKVLQTATDSMGRTVSIEYNVQDAAPYGLCDRITYKGFGGEDKIIRVSKTNLSNALRPGLTINTTENMFPTTCEATFCEGNLFNPSRVVSALWLPDGTSYKFLYNSFAEVARVEFPTGAAVEYDHDYSVLNPGLYDDFALARKVVEKRIYADSSSQNSLISKTKYQTVIDTANRRTIVTVDQTDAGNDLLTRTVSHFHGDPKVGYQNPNDNYSFPYGILSWKNGREYQTDFYANDGTTLLRRVQNEWQNKTLSWWGGDQSTAPPNDTRPVSTVAVTLENGKALAVLKKTEYDENGSADPAYFSHLNIKKSKAYNYKVLDLNTAQNASLQTIAALFSENDLASVSETDYSYDPNYKARGILGLPTETRVLNPSNPSDALAKSQFVYDETTYFDNNYTTTNWEDPNSNLRGNVTTARTWNKDTNTWIESHTMFDNFGNVRKVWDTSGDPTRFVETEYDPVYKYAYPTRTKAPAPDPTGINGTTEGSEISRVYDFNTGLMLSVTDANGQTATTEYDNLLRPVRINPPAGGSVSEMIYNDTPNNIWVKSRQQIDANNWAESTTFYDNLGRAIKTSTKDLQGDVMSQVRFDNFGRVEKTSNPYRVDANGNPTETVYWSKLRYDEANRVVETYAPAPEGQTGISLGTAQFGISTMPGLVGTYAVAIDASGRKSRAISGIYGLMRVDEATAKGETVDQDLGTLANPTQPTFYSYNIKGEMTKITQGSQNRYFMYDSLGRLIRVRQPEQTSNPNLATAGNPENDQWTAGYSYDVFGNVIRFTDAKGINIVNEYDKAGRATSRCYTKANIQTTAIHCSQLTASEISLDTPQVDYYYDGKGLPQTPQFSRGSLTKVTNGISEHLYSSFDNHRRLLTSQQITDGQTYNFAYKYNLSGGLIEETYPSGRVVKNILDTDGGLSAVTTKASAGSFRTVAANFDYSSTGAVRKMMLGNGKWETAQFNERFQPLQLGLGNSPTDKSLWKIDYEYGELSADGTTVITAQNTGSIARQTEMVK